VVKYRHEVGRNVVDIEREAHRARGAFVNMVVKDSEDQALLRQRLSNRFLVKGRPYSGGVIWDVYALSGDKPPVLLAGGFVWQEEAIAFARDRKLGRNSVSFGGIRGLFSAGSGGLSIPSRTIEMPGAKRVNVRQTNSGVVVG
jgi:hypothetical protein